MRKRKQLKRRRRPPLELLNSTIYPWSMRWRVAWAGVALTLLCVSLGFKNTASYRWASYLSKPINSDNLQASIAFPENAISVSSDLDLSDGRTITLNTPAPPQKTQQTGNLYHHQDTGDTIQLKISRRTSGKTFDEYEKDLREQFLNSPMKVFFSRFRHPMGPAIEVVFERLTSDSTSEDPIRYVLILPDDTEPHRQYALTATCLVDSTRAFKVIPIFDQIVNQVRLKEPSSGGSTSFSQR